MKIIPVRADISNKVESNKGDKPTDIGSIPSDLFLDFISNLMISVDSEPVKDLEIQQQNELADQIDNTVGDQTSELNTNMMFNYIDLLDTNNDSDKLANNDCLIQDKKLLGELTASPSALDQFAPEKMVSHSDQEKSVDYIPLEKGSELKEFKDKQDIEENNKLLNQSSIEKQNTKTGNIFKEFQKSHSHKVLSINSIGNNIFLSEAISQQNKYTNAFVQLGEFINERTIQVSKSEMINNELRSENLVKQQSNSPQFMSAENDLRIELLPTSDGLSLNETYNANIKIYPPELGRVMAKLKINKNDAELTILTENEKVKEIIQANLLQLKENFNKSDIQLTSISVQINQEMNKEQQNKNHQHEAPQTNKTDFIIQEKVSEDNSERVARTQIDSLLDTYA